MAEPAKRQTSRARVMRHRTKAVAQGSRRVEVTVPDADAALIRAVARTLRAGGQPAAVLRRRLTALVAAPQAETGRELLAFFRSSPLCGVELDLERDRSTGREVDLE